MKSHWLPNNPQIVGAQISGSQVPLMLKLKRTRAERARARDMKSLFRKLFPEFKGLSPSALALLLASVSTVIVVVGLVVFSSRLPLPGVSDSPLPGLQIATHDHRDAFLAKMEHAQLKKLAGKVHFISQIISATNRRKASEAKELAYAIVMESEQAGIDPLFVAAVIKSESTFRRTARSHVGAVGLMQLLPTTGKYIARKRSITWKGASSLKDPRTNIRLGIAYIQYLKRLFKGDMNHVLIAYNWGPGSLKKAFKSGTRAPRGPREYANKILKNSKRWGSDFQSRQQEYRFFNVNYLSS